MVDDDDVDGCEADFCANPCSDDEAEALVAPASRDRTEEQEEDRRRAI
jgi:hypothetical protein